MLNRFFRGGGNKANAAAPPPPQKSPTPPPPVPPPASTPIGGGAGAAVAVNKVDDTLQVLELREAKLQKQIDDQTEKAKAAMTKGNKLQALTCMKRKKTLDDQIAKNAAQRANLETMQAVIEESAITAAVVEAQRAAGLKIEEINKTIDLETLEDDMDKIYEQIEKQREIARLLGQPFGDEFLDDDELLGELNALMEADEAAVRQQAVPANAVPAQSLPDLGPSVPTGKLPTLATPVQELDDEAALRALEVELAE